MTFINLNYSETVARCKQINERLEALAGKHRLSKADEQEVEELRQDLDEFDEHRERLERSAELRAAARGGVRGLKLEAGSPGQDEAADARGGGVRGAAMRALDAAVQDDRLPARAAEVVEDLMRSGTGLAQSWTQRWAAATGAEAYERAFAKKVTDPDNGHLTWTPEEADAWRTVAGVQTEQRAMSTSDPSGGFMIPLTLDPAIQITSGGSINPLRQLATVTQIATDSWNGVTSAGVTAEWTAEAAEVADASPTLAQPSIPTFKGDAFVPFSFEVQGDAANFLSELSKLLVDGAEQLSATAYTTGNGTTQPKGLITALAAAAGTVPLIAPGTAETLSPGDAYTVQNALPPRFQPGAQWVGHLAIINTLRQFETGNGSLKFPALQDNPPYLLGRPMNELSNMDGTINAAATESNYPLVYGDFARGFRIIDRVGSTLELVPHLFGSNRRPTGQRGALLWFRTGSDVVIPNAFRMLSIPTTA